DLNQAISMISYFASSSEPAQVRGKTVYIQYSNRQEIVNNKVSGEAAGNVLLVTIEGVEAGDVSIDVIHLVSSVTVLTLLSKILFQIIDQLLSIRCSLPLGLFTRLLLSKRLLAFRSFHFFQHFLVVKSNWVQLQFLLLCCCWLLEYLIQFSLFPSDVTTAAVAKEALEGHCIYDGGYCKLHLSYSRHTDLNVKAYSDKSRDYTISSSGMLSNPQASSVPSASTGWQTNPQAAGTSVGSIGMQAPVPAGQTAAWDPSKTTFATSAGTFPGQPFVPSAGAPFPTSGGPPSAPAGYFQASQQRPQYGVQPRPSSGAPPFGHPPGYF
ncbi:hypothetical protein GW17_00058268, partial [Ensete ventricosum]